MQQKQNKGKEKKEKKRKKKKKGFTLVELLAVIVILAVVMVITVPTVLGSMGKAKEKAFNTAVQAVQAYINKQIENCKFGNKDIAPYDETTFILNSCEINTLQSVKILELSGYEDSLTNLSVDKAGQIISAIGINELKGNKFIFIEKPDVSNTGLVPIKYDETKSKWVVTSENDSDWYDYDNQKWANAASLTATGKEKNIGDTLDLSTDVYAMFVWIPRYSYTIGCTPSSLCYGYKVDTDTTSLSRTTPGAIDIKFVSKNTKEIYQNSETSGTSPTYTYSTTDTEDQRISKREEASNWYTHPAFTFGDKELSGIWVGKFETTETASIPTILPNKASLRRQTVSEQFTTAQQFTTNTSIYGLTGDAHMMKNSEWGAVAYLSQSIYGKYGNPNYTGANKEIYQNKSSSYKTGFSNGTPGTSTTNTQCKYDNITDRGGGTGACGAGASTTGNIYGIYDMSGGALENVMGNYNDGTKQVTGDSRFASEWFNEETNKKYFDKYTYSSELFTIKDNSTNGGALAETNNWYRDYATTDYGSSYPWLDRGGHYSSSSDAGPFYGLTFTGGSSYISFRVSFASNS